MYSVYRNTLMLYMEIIAVCSQIFTNVNKIYTGAEYRNFLMLRVVVRNVTTEVKIQDNVAEVANAASSLQYDYRIVNKITVTRF